MATVGIKGLIVSDINRAEKFLRGTGCTNVAIYCLSVGYVLVYF